MRKYVILWTKGRVHDPNAAVLVVNALCFHDPGEDSGRGHLGTHPANITVSRNMMRPDGT